jgi:hypothetical protein
VRALIQGATQTPEPMSHVQENMPPLPPFLPAAMIHGSHSTASGEDQQTHRSAPRSVQSSRHSSTQIIDITDCDAETAAFQEPDTGKPSIPATPKPASRVPESAVSLKSRRPSDVPTAGRNDADWEKLQSLRVAVVDDEPANQRIACRFLKGLGVPTENITVMRDGTWFFAGPIGSV